MNDTGDIMKNRYLAAACALLFAGGDADAADIDRALHKEVVVNASIADVWRAWTSDAGVETFFARAADIDLRVDGRYDIHFFPDQPPGRRGAEGMRILAIEPESRFAFTWNAPTDWPRVRAMRTFVDIRFDAAGDGATRVRLRHDGWGDGDDWDQAFAYFDGAWEVVLKRLKYRFDRGPVDWDRLPADLLYSYDPG